MMWDFNPAEPHVPIGKESWVYSQKEGSFVENIVLGVEDVGSEQVWVGEAVLVALGCDLGRQPSSRVALWVSPPCRIFSKTDTSNRPGGTRGGEGA